MCVVSKNVHLYAELLNSEEEVSRFEKKTLQNTEDCKGQ